jgi:hypothetical protein
MPPVPFSRFHAAAVFLLSACGPRYDVIIRHGTRPRPAAFTCS